MSQTHSVFFARRPDGKFYRGAILWQWTRSWRRAAVLPMTDWIFLRNHGRIPWNTEFLGLNDVYEIT